MKLPEGACSHSSLAQYINYVSGLNVLMKWLDSSAWATAPCATCPWGLKTLLQSEMLAANCTWLSGSLSQTGQHANMFLIWMDWLSCIKLSVWPFLLKLNQLREKYFVTVTVMDFGSSGPCPFSLASASWYWESCWPVSAQGLRYLAGFSSWSVCEWEEILTWLSQNHISFCFSWSFSCSWS